MVSKVPIGCRHILWHNCKNYKGVFTYYRQILFKNNIFKKVNFHFFANFLENLCSSTDSLGKVIKRKEKKRVSTHPFLEIVWKVDTTVNTLFVKSLPLKKFCLYNEIIFYNGDLQ